MQLPMPQWLSVWNPYPQVWNPFRAQVWEKTKPRKLVWNSRSTLEEPAGVESTTSGVESISRPTFEESDFTKGVEGLMVPLPNQGGMLK